jgi:hypothetical protein
MFGIEIAKALILKNYSITPQLDRTLILNRCLSIIIKNIYLFVNNLCNI